MRTYLTLVVVALSFGVSAQIISIKKVELAGEKIILHYDLEDANKNHLFVIDVFSSQDNFNSPLTKVTGDVGEEVAPGNDKKISWNIIQEYGGYKGKVMLEIRGKIHMPVVKFQNLNANKSYKRGKTYMLAMKAGNTNPIHIELYKGGERVAGETNHPNNGTYALSIPSSAKKGDNYRLKVTDSKNNEEIIYSSFFKVKPRLPLIVKILPVVVIGGAIAVLAGGSGSKENAATNAKLPDPPSNN